MFFLFNVMFICLLIFSFYTDKSSFTLIVFYFESISQKETIEFKSPLVGTLRQIVAEKFVNEKFGETIHLPDEGTQEFPELQKHAKLTFLC